MYVGSLAGQGVRHDLFARIKLDRPAGPCCSCQGAFWVCMWKLEPVEGGASWIVTRAVGSCSRGFCYVLTGFGT